MSGQPAPPGSWQTQVLPAGLWLQSWARCPLIVSCLLLFPSGTNVFLPGFSKSSYLTQVTPSISVTSACSRGQNGGSEGSLKMSAVIWDHHLPWKENLPSLIQNNALARNPKLCLKSKNRCLIFLSATYLLCLVTQVGGRQAGRGDQVPSCHRGLGCGPAVLVHKRLRLGSAAHPAPHVGQRPIPPRRHWCGVSCARLAGHCTWGQCCRFHPSLCVLKAFPGWT